MAALDFPDPLLSTTYTGANGVIYTYVGTAPNGYWTAAKEGIDFSQYAELDNDQQSITAKEFIGDGSQLTGVVNKLTAGGGIALDPTDGQGTVEISSTVDTLTYKGTVDVTIQKPAAFTAAIAEIQDMYLNTGLGTFHSSWADVTDNADTSTEANPGDFMVYNQTSWDHIPAGSPPGTDGTWIDDGAGKLYPATTTNNVGIGTNSPGAKLDVRGDSLGSTAGDSVALGRFYNSTQTNSSQLFISSERVTDGSTWSTTSIRLQRFVDTQPQAYIDFTANRGTGTGQQDIAFGMGTIERMRITKQGNVGIGTTDPKSPLHVNGITRLEIVDPGTCLSMYADGKAYVYMGATDNKNFFINAGGETRIISFRTGGIDRVTIVDNGNVGIGTTDPKSPLHIFDNSIGLPAAGKPGHLQVGGGQYGLMIGADGSGRGYLQAQRSDDTDTTYDLYLNPNGGNVSIGTTNPAKLLDVNGDALINSVTVGRGAGDKLSNTVVGNNGLSQNTTGGNNTAVGRATLEVNTEGNGNTAVGNYALNLNTIGINNTAVGDGTLKKNTEGIENTAVGRNAMPNNTKGGNNVAVGRNALLGNTEGGYNTIIGDGALRNNITGNYNTAVGRFAGRYIEGSNNTILGAYEGTAADATLNSTVIISAGATERIRIDSIGNVGIGTTDPSYKLDVAGDLNATNYRIDQLPELV